MADQEGTPPLSCTNPEVGDWLLFYLLGDISPENRQKVEEHIPACAFCEQELRANENVSEDRRRSGSGKFHVTLSEEACRTIVQLARKRNTTVTEIIRLGLGLVVLVDGEIEKNNKLIITTANGLPLREIVLPDKNENH